MTKTTVEWKREEDRILETFKNYLQTTYDGHYAYADGSHTIDHIAARGSNILEGFCVGNIMKYVDRRKSPSDLYKAMHYIMFLLYYLHLHERTDGDES